MKKKLARLVVILIALATCLLFIAPIFADTTTVDLPKVSTIEETSPTEETIQIAETTIVDLELLSIEEIAAEVIAGLWGNGEHRRISLEEAGYNADEIQNYINSITPVLNGEDSIPTIALPECEYPEATYIWNVMRSWGWSPETCAGIIGNMMAEVGGGTLDLSNWHSNGSSGYGLIQWLNARRRLIKSRYGEYPTIDDQLEYMRDEMMGTNNTPWQFSNTEQYNKVMYGETPEECAYAFACYFERCGEEYRWIRRSYARIAYEYFMN